MAQAEEMEVEEGQSRAENMEEDEDEFTPDETPPKTTEAEDEELLTACEKETEGENTLSGKEEKLQTHFAKIKASKEKIATI